MYTRGPHGGEWAPYDSETPYVGEKGPHEAKGTMESKGPIKAKELQQYRRPQRESSSFSATPEWL